MYEYSAHIINVLQKELLLNRAELAKLLGISITSLSNYLKGERFPRMPIIRRIKTLAEENQIEFDLDKLLLEKNKETDKCT